MKKIKVYLVEQEPLSRAILQVMGLFTQVTPDEGPAGADVILVSKREKLNAVYREDKLFGLIAESGVNSYHGLPKNIFVIQANVSITGEQGLIKFVDWANEKLTQQQPEKKVVVPPLESFTDRPKFRREYTVLVIDNDHGNRSLATRLLSDAYASITLCADLESLVTSMDNHKFDAVLTDMHMPPDRFYSSLSMHSIIPGQDVPYGFAVILEATKRGVPVAVVTDANHHQDWVSAMFDHIKEATVNGQRVLFFNNIRKRWDIALKALMEP